MKYNQYEIKSDSRIVESIPKLNVRISSSHVLSLFIIFWCGGWSSLFPLTIKSIIGFGFTIVGLCYSLISLNKTITRFDLYLLALSIGIPFLSAVQANLIFGQPFFTGLLSLRQFFNLLIVYYFIYKFKNVDLPKYICQYQLFIMVLDTVMLYGFNIDSNRMLGFIPQDENTAFVKSEAMENELRGLRLTFGSGFTYIALSIWTVRYYLYRKKKDLWKIIFVLLFVLFVTKTRVQLLVCTIILLLPLIQNLNVRSFIKLVVYIGCIGIIFFSIPGLSSRFLVISDLLGNTRTQGMGDFSGVARLNEIIVAWSYILRYPLFGVGNISYHFDGGFEGVLGEYFFLADIGVFGMLFMGGLNFLFLYYNLIISAKRRNVKKNASVAYRKVLSFILFTYAMIPFMGTFPILDGPVMFSLIIYMAITKLKHENYLSC